MPNYVSRALGGVVLNSSIKTTNYTVRISGTPVFCVAGSLQITLNIGRRSQAAFTAHTSTSVHFQQYQQVTIFDQNSVLVFRGFITSEKEQKMGFQNTLIHTITCADMHFLADKRIIAKTYTNSTCGTIVSDILNTVLKEEGVILGQIAADGLLPSSTLYPSPSLYPGGSGSVPTVTFAYCTVAAALDSLVTYASTAGIPYYWMIDQNKKLYFVPYTAIVNSNPIDGSWMDQVNNPVTVQRQNPKYRNREWISGGTEQTAVQNEVRVGDGNSTSWTMGYPLATAPIITLSTTGGGQNLAQIVGLKGTTGSQYYWAVNDPVITQDSSQAKLGATQTLKITYTGQVPSIVVTQNNPQIAAQAALDGTSGIIETVDTDTSLTDATSAILEASQILARYSVSGTLVQGTTMVSGYLPGQLVTVDLPMHGILKAQMLIESVVIADLDNVNIWYTINAVQGPYDTTWVQFFSQLLTTQHPATNITIGNATTPPPAPILTTQDAAIRFKLGAGTTHTARSLSAAMRFRLKTSGTVTPITVSLSAINTAPKGTVTATVSTPGGGGGGSTPTIQVYKFGDNTNTSAMADNSGNGQYIYGTDLLFYWSQIEPSEGSYNWAPMESQINLWHGYNDPLGHPKKSILRLMVSGWGGWAPPYSKQGTPQWVYNAGVKSITQNDGAIKPEYWNTTFLAKLDALIAAYAAKYDGDSRLLAIQLAVGDGGETKVDTRGEGTAATLALWKAIGYTDDLWWTAIKAIMGSYSKYFTHTPLILMPDSSFIGGTSGYNETKVVAYATGVSADSPYQSNGTLTRPWLQNNGIGPTTQPDPRWSITTVVGEQRNKLASANPPESLEGMMQDMIRYKSKYALCFLQDLESTDAATIATLKKYATYTGG